MSESPAAISLQPLVSYPREAEVGTSYMLTVDLRPADDSAWPYPEEEYAIYCELETAPLFSHRPLGEPAVVLHRFGGTYGPASFVLTALSEGGAGAIRLHLLSAAGLPLASAELPVRRVGPRRAPPPPHAQAAAPPPTNQAPAPADEIPREQAQQEQKGPEQSPQPQPAFPYAGPPILIASEGPGAGQELFPNGVDGATGDYLLRIDVASAGRLAGNDRDSRELRAAENARIKISEAANYGTVAGLDTSRLDQARWAVVVSHAEDAGLLKAIWPLIELRMMQMGFSRRDVDFRAGESCGDWYIRHADGEQPSSRSSWGQSPPVLIYRPGESVNRWLARHGASAGPVDPRRGVPYYLTLLGRPGPLGPDDQAAIPLEFQRELSVFFAVGRLCFSDSAGQHRLGAYTAYAERVAAFERASDPAARLRRECVYFGTRHELDIATQRSADELIAPLARWHRDPESLASISGYGATLLLGPEATRANLGRALRDESGRPPAVLVAAAHGLGLSPADARQPAHQGAIVTQDWGGPGAIGRDHYLAGEDLGDGGLDGMVALLYASFSAGTPMFDEAIVDEGQERLQLAPFDQVSQLAQALLERGALGVFGFAGRYWGPAQLPDGTGGAAEWQLPQDMLHRLLRGDALGYAADQIGLFRAQAAADLARELDEIRFGKQPAPAPLALAWARAQSLRALVLLGDPAARLPASPA